MRDTDPLRGRSAELWVRSHAPAGIDREQHALVERLEVLVDAGGLADRSVRSWPTEVALSRTATRAPESAIVLDRVAAFRSWARRTGHSLSPYFRTRELEATVTGEPHAAQVLPVRAMIEYRDGRVVHVAPSVAPDGEPVGVDDRLERLERVLAETPGGDPDRALADPGTER